jgi:glycosyltransferase involved in cell wall biosynthesis
MNGRTNALLDQVSVIIPCHNDGLYLKEAVQSVLNQTGDNYVREVIVVDDGSTSPLTHDILARLPVVDKRIRVCAANQRTPGPAGARNQGAALASGTWLAFLDADDLWQPDSLTQRFAALKYFPDAQWITADFYYYGLEETNLSFSSCLRKKPPYLLPIIAEALESGLPMRLSCPVEAVIYNIAWIGTVLITRSLFKQVGGFDEALYRGEDGNLWQRLALKTDLIFVPQPLASYRQRPGSLTNVEEPPGTLRVNTLKYLKKDTRFARYHPLIDREILYFSDANIYYHRRRGEIIQALRWSIESLTYVPFRMRSWKNLIASAMGI